MVIPIGIGMGIVQANNRMELCDGIIIISDQANLGRDTISLTSVCHTISPLLPYIIGLSSLFDVQFNHSLLWPRGQNLSQAAALVNRASGPSQGHYCQKAPGPHGMPSCVQVDKTAGSNMGTECGGMETRMQIDVFLSSALIVLGIMKSGWGQLGDAGLDGLYWYSC